MTRRKRMIHCMHGFLLMGSLLLHSCSGETQLDGENGIPEGKDPLRQEVLLNINNKLVLHKTATRDIATAEENAISTLDVYVFGSPTEDGTYTFQERFAYRENTDDLPADAKELILNAGATDNVTTGLLSLHRGLFVKLYCIANDTKPVNADGTEVEADDFTPITFTTGGSIMEREGSPTEADFLKYHTRLLNGDILNTPLTMSGAQTLPLDLTDASVGTRLQVNFKLTRLAARFDVVNKADESRFTIESISMGNARRGAGYFPIVTYGAHPAADGDLTTTADRPFMGDNANTGTQTGAFYCYPSMQEDEGFLMLKGHYKVNETETKEVSYRIPFRQKGVDGQETYLDINNNHRYTIGITKADELRLEFTLNVADWADDGNIDDYEPDNKPGEITVSIPTAFQDRSTAILDPDRNVYTVSMSLDTGSSFDMTVGSSSPGIKIVYAGGPSAQKNNWLVCNPKTTTRISSGSDYTFSIKEDYTGLFPRATVRVYDVLSGMENILYVDAVAVPQLLATAQPEKAPNGTSDNPNSFDVTTATVTLYRITDSKAQVSFLCPDDMEVVGKPNWIDVSDVVRNGAKNTYILTLNNRDIVLPGTTGNTRTAEATDNTVIFANSKDKDKLRIPVAIVLKDAPVIPLFIALGGSNNSYTEPAEDHLGKITMSVASGNTCTVPVTSMDGVTVEFDFGSNPAWLISEIKTTGTSAGSNQQSVMFKLVNDNLPNAKDVSVTLKNKIGGADRKFVISPNVGNYSLTKVDSSSPAADQLSGTDITLYKLGGSKDSYIKLNATYWGGSTLTSSNTSALKVETVSSSGNDITYKLTALAVNDNVKLTLASRVDPGKTQEYSVVIKEFAAPTLNQTSATINTVKNNGGSTTVKVTALDGYGYKVKTAPSSYYVSYTISGNDYTLTSVRPGSTKIVFCNKMDETKTADFSVTINTSVLYEGKAVWYYNGYYIAPEDASSSTSWNSSLTSTYCSNKSGASWRVPSSSDACTIYNVALGSSATADNTAVNFLKNIFTGSEYWTTTGSDGGSGPAYIIHTSNGKIYNSDSNIYKLRIRCVTR